MKFATFAVLMLAASPALGQNGPASAPVPRPANGAPANPKDEKISCREESHTGTRIAHSVCRSAAEWAVLDDATSKVARKFVDDVVLRGANTGNINYEKSVQGLVP